MSREYSTSKAVAFHSRLKALLKEFQAEIQIEDKGGSYSPAYSIVVDFEGELVGEDYVLYDDLDLGTWECGDD